MAVKSIDVWNFMVFQQIKADDKDEEVFEERLPDGGFRLQFCDGINVLIGENGVGKTTLLKMIYAAVQCSTDRTDSGKFEIRKYFSNHLTDDRILKNEGQGKAFSGYRVSDGEACFVGVLSNSDTVKRLSVYSQFLSDWRKKNIQSVFIPTTEMLSHAKGFLALNAKYHMPFDATQIDIIVNASLPETREIPENMGGILDKISDAIDGTVELEDDIFYVIKRDGRKIDFSLEAEGLRKLGLLWKLIRNGLLEKDSILLWDEPEANLNPELYPLVAEILLSLQEGGVQIFVATHSYNFAKYLEIRRGDKEQVMFHNLYKSDAEAICSGSAHRLEELELNHIVMADERLLDEVYRMQG